MMNEEAIMILKAMIDEMILVFDRDRKKALNMAIEALKEQPEHNQNTSSKQPDLETLGIKTEKTCEDAISRQAAIDVVRRCSVKEVAPAYMLIDKAEVMTELMMLPSAQPEPEIKPIEYRDCANAMLMMWMDNVVTDGEYSRIMDKLNAHEIERRNNE